MTHEESIAEARRTLEHAGFAPAAIRITGQHPDWCVSVKGLGAGATDASDETMDQPHEVAAALVRAMGERKTVAEPSEAVEAGGHEAHSETGAEGERALDEGSAGGLPLDEGNLQAGTSEAGPLVSSSDLLASEPVDITDADFANIETDLTALPPPDDSVVIMEGDLEPLGLPEPDPEDFAPDPIVEPDLAAGVAIFGDNLPMQRLILIGAVTRYANALKARHQEGWTVEEFRELQNLTMRISQGLAPEDDQARARFMAISEASRIMNAIDAHAESQVALLETATREQVDAYKVEEGWP